MNHDEEYDDDLSDEEISKIEELDAAIDEARDKVAVAVKEWAAIAMSRFTEDDDPPYVQAWMVALEWTNSELSQNYGTAGGYIHPDEQLGSTSLGLCHRAVGVFS